MDFSQIEKLFLQAVKLYVYGKVFVVLELINFDLCNKLVTLKFRYGIVRTDTGYQNNVEFSLSQKDFSNLEYLRGRFEQHMETYFIDRDLWEHTWKEEK